MIDLASLYRDIVENSPDGIWVIDLDGRTIYANPVIARMYGIPYAEVDTLTVQDTLDDAGKAQFAAHLRRVSSGEPNESEVEVYFVNRLGEGSWITLRESILYDDRGAPVALLHRIADYETRRRVLDELTSSRAQLQEAQAIARLGSWTYDVASGEVRVLGDDPRLAPVLPIGTLQQLLDVVHPDDLEETRALASGVLTGDREFSFDTRLRTGEGWVHLRLRGVVHLDELGRPFSVTGTHQDVTEIKATEARLRDEVDQAALMRAISTAANGARTLRGVAEEAMPLLLARADWVRAALFLAQPGGLDRMGVLSHPDPADAVLAERARADGGMRWSDDGTTVAVPIMVGDRVYAVGTVTSAVAPKVRDLVETMVHAVAVQLGRVAEREEAERSLAAARDEAMSASLQKSEFLATMSHEIRTPLNGIIGLNDLLMRTPLEPDQQRLASGVHIAGRALLSVINDVLDFSKIDGRLLELEEVDVEIRPMLDQVVRVLSGSATAGRVELIASCHHDVPAAVLGDPTRLSQVLLNLISNAVKFSGDGEVLVRADLAPAASTSEGDVLLRFEVRDTGIGVEPAQVDRLFEPFMQGDASTTRRYGGTGLGLAISREIVAALGGELGYRPNPDGGSIFTFTAMCRRMDEPTESLDSYARTWLRGRRILVADASAHRAEALVEQLAWWELAVDRVATGPAAQAALAQSLNTDQPYDAVLIDLDPPNDGLGLVRAVASESAYDEIAMLALGPTTERELEQLRETGVSVVLGRPLPAEVLRGTLLEQLAGMPAQPQGHVPVALPQSDRQRILVVEDNPVNQMVATGLLESMGYAVEISPDGAHALDVLAKTSFDAILMDVQMPVLDGYATTRTLRERESGSDHVPVIAMTAAAVDGERERCLAAGMDEFLTKPVDPTALATALRRWLTTDTTPEPIAMTSPTSDGPDGGYDGSDGYGDDTVGGLPPTPPMPGLDTERLDMLRDLDPGDTTYIDRAIGNFQVNSAAAVTEIRGLVEAGDAPGLKATAHKIAGSALNLGVPRAGEAARALEIVANTGSTAGAAELLPELEQAMLEGRDLLLAYQATYSR